MLRTEKEKGKDFRENGIYEMAGSKRIRGH